MSSSAPPAISARAVTKSFGRLSVLRGMDLEVRRGEVVGLLGPNGAGKSTLVGAIAGVVPGTGGTILVENLDPSRQRDGVSRVLGVQLQHPVFHEALTVREILSIYSRFYPRPWPVADLLATVGLTEQAGTRSGRLSGGQHQRLALATALIGRTPVLVLDEFTAGLDPYARERMWRCVERLRAQGISILIVSHSMDEVERLCDRIVVMRSGRVVADASAPELIAKARANDARVATLTEAYLSLTGAGSSDGTGGEQR